MGQIHYGYLIENCSAIKKILSLYASSNILGQDTFYQECECL